MAIEILEEILDDLPYEVVSEYRFTKTRKFRMDYCIFYNDRPLLGIEYEGISFNQDKTRHQTGIGYSRDCEKYNLALSLGLPTLRYTVIHMKDPDQVKTEILKAISILISQN